jgi:hypothetical protein
MSPKGNKPNDQAHAASMIGKHVLIGLTYCDHNGVPLEQVQLHGDIVEIDDGQVTIKNSSGEDFITLPPDLSAFSEAAPGEYRLRSTGEIVIDPDFLTQWTIQRPAPEE